MSSKNQQLGKQVETVKRIHKQLAEDFYPNLKNVSIAAAAFNKTQESNQKAFADYLNSLNRFANSAKTAEPEAKQLAKELMILIKHFRKIGEETSKLVGEFGQLTLRIQTNAENEVKVHKNLLNKYLKEQKTIHKDVEKRRKTVKDLEDFYSQKYEETVNYQAVRYRFFTEKHTKLLKSFSEVTKELSEKMESFDSVVDHQSTKPVESETAGSEVTRPKSDVENGYIVVNEEENRAQLEKVFDDKQDDTIKRFLKEYQEENGTSSRNHLETQSSVSKVESHDRVTNSAKRLENIYSTPPTIPKRNEENVQPLPKPLPLHYSEADNFEPIPQPKKTSTLLRNDGYVSIDTTSTAPIRKFVELDQPKTEQTKPQPLPRQPFTAADYGSILICSTTYGAKSDRQLSLNLGETAELIRCGQRGWVLLRTFSGLRIGWFPAKFVRFATDEEKLFDSQPS